MAEWFTADPHFDHKNIVEYCKRPYRTADGQIDVQAMNRAIIQNWNDRVQPGDTTYLLGDVAMGNKKNLAGWRRRLNGKIVLIRGNHDPRTEFCLGAGFDEVHNNLSITRDGCRLYLRHVPFLIPEALPDCDLILCGHVHDLFRIKGFQVNVGVDQWAMYPISLKEILTEVATVK